MTRQEAIDNLIRCIENTRYDNCKMLVPVFYALYELIGVVTNEISVNHNDQLRTPCQSKTVGGGVEGSGDDRGDSRVKPTARIRPAKDGALWLFVDAPGAHKTAADDLNTLIKETLRLDDPGSIAYAILPEEVEAIRDACNEYLEEVVDEPEA